MQFLKPCIDVVTLQDFNIKLFINSKFYDINCPPQVPDNTPVKKANLGEPADSFDSDEEEEHMRVTIKPKARPTVTGLGAADGSLPKLAAPIKLLPPPKSPSRQAGYQVQPDRFNPFDKVRLTRNYNKMLVKYYSL